MCHDWITLIQFTEIARDRRKNASHAINGTVFVEDRFPTVMLMRSREINTGAKRMKMDFKRKSFSWWHDLAPRQTAKTRASFTREKLIFDGVILSELNLRCNIGILVDWCKEYRSTQKHGRESEKKPEKNAQRECYSKIQKSSERVPGMMKEITFEWKFT